MARRGRKPPEPLDASTGRSRALRALGRREHSARELKAKLAHDGLDRPTAAVVVDELGEAGWQSDGRYASLLVRSRIAQGYGPLRIRAELSAKGVDAALIVAALDEADADWSAIACRIYRRKYAAPATDAKEAASRYRFMATRGFNSAQIRAATAARKEDLPESGFDDDPGEAANLDDDLES